MGCDIHFFIEHKTPKGDWYTVDREGANLWRDYELFAFLAGVRGNTEQIPHGEVPSDLSEYLSKKFSERDYYHSITCITLQEFLNFNWERKWLNTYREHGEKTVCDHCGSTYYKPEDGCQSYAQRFSHLVKIIECMKTIDENFVNVRAIMAFDN